MLRQGKSRSRRIDALRQLVPFPVAAIIGAEGDGDGGEGETPPAPKPAATKTDGDKSYSQEYVDELRGEAKATREKAKETITGLATENDELKERLKAFEDAEKSDMERLTSQVEELTTVSTSQASELREARLDNAILQAAFGEDPIVFHDPLLVKAKLDIDAVFDGRSGKVNQEKLMSQLKQIAEDSPFLVRTADYGSADGGPTGRKLTADDAEKARIAKYEKQFADRGMIKIPQ